VVLGIVLGTLGAIPAVVVYGPKVFAYIDEGVLRTAGARRRADIRWLKGQIAEIWRKHEMVVAESRAEMIRISAWMDPSHDRWARTGAARTQTKHLELTRFR
jgi:hypothetical protein